MNRGAEAEMIQYIDRALMCLLDGAQNLLMRSSASVVLDNKEMVLQKLDLLQLSYESLGQRIKHHIADTNQQLNCHAPIDRLPNELLVKIFDLANVDVIFWGHRSGLDLLRLLSNEWNRIISETPSLWAQIHSTYPDRLNAATVLRSKETPLRVGYDDIDVGGGFEGDWDGDRATAFINLASEESSRWQSLRFHLREINSLALLRSFANLPVPRLKELEISSGISVDLTNVGSIDIFSGGAASLRHIKLYQIPFLWSSKLLSRLETLEIVGLYLGLCPTMHETLDILRRCPELHTFNLRYHYDDRIPPSSIASPSESEVVHLNLLSSFTLRLENPAAFRRIISTARIPACTEFNLYCDSPSINLFSNETSHVTIVLSSALQSLSESLLTLSAYKLEVFGHNGRERVKYLSLGGKPPWENLAWLMDRGEATWLPSAVKIQCDVDLSFSQAADFLRRCPSITNLKLTDHLNPYMTLLTDPMLNNDTYEWVLPNLRELSLQRCPMIDLQLLEELESRRQGGVGIDREPGRRLALPARLEKIDDELLYIY
ncbi:hypothetical protein FRB95_008140 [Tulasnella sp. JGI-2019a]|nr:hypothetical protein FRB95_008140 [Tulasnella sp. JGI-2019a]